MLFISQTNIILQCTIEKHLVTPCMHACMHGACREGHVQPASLSSPYLFHFFFTLFDMLSYSEFLFYCIIFHFFTDSYFIFLVYHISFLLYHISYIYSVEHNQSHNQTIDHAINHAINKY